MTSTPSGSTSSAVTGQVNGSVVQARDIGSVIINSSGGPWRRHVTASLDDRLAGLRAKVLEQWQHEVGVRGLHQPRPVRLRWRSTSRPVEVSSSREPLRGALSHDVTDRNPVAQELVDSRRADSRQQLVVLGAPGSGKSTLAVLYTLAAAADPEHPVPVLLSIAGWRPWDPNAAAGEPVEKWVARRIADDHPELAVGTDVLRQLWAGRRLVPVLDGLDEMPPSMLTLALADLDRSAGAGLDMVLTCRTAEYERGVSAGNALSHAAVVDIEPVGVDDAAVYLTQRETGRSRRWNQVLDLMRQEPDSPVAAALSTPLMISLARQIYRDPTTDPSELAALATADAVRQHLLTQFLPSVYPHERERTRSARWLSFLAHHLRDRVGDPNFEWWRLTLSAPTGVIAIMITVVAAALGAVLTPAVAFILGASSTMPVLPGVGAIVGVVVGVPAALRSMRAATVTGRAAKAGLVRAIVSGVARDIRVLLTVGSALVVSALVPGYLFARPVVVSVDFAFVRWARDMLSHNTSASIPALMIIIVTLGVITVTNGLSALSGGLPQRSTPRPRLLAPSVAVGLAIGMAFAFPLLPLGLLTPLGTGDGVGLWLLVAGSVGVPIGLTRWLATPAEEQAASSPENLLHWDRRALLATVTVSAVVGALATSLASLTFPEQDRPPALPVGLVLGVTIGSIVLISSGNAWLTYTMARLWLALVGRLPWRLNRFLRNAHAIGVLRQTGPAYQLRHDLLNDHLADQWRPAPAGVGPTVSRRRARRRSRRWLSPMVLASSLVLLVAAVPIIYVDNAPFHLDADIPHGHGMVLSLDGHTLAVIDSAARPPGSMSTPPTVRVFDVASGRLIRTVSAEPLTTAIQAIDLNADGSELTMITLDFGRYSYGGYLRHTAVWRWPAKGGPPTQLAGATARINGLAVNGTTAVRPTRSTFAFSPNGNTLAIAEGGETIQLWDLIGDRSLSRPVQPQETAELSIHDLAYSVDGRLLAVLHSNGSVAVIDVLTNAVIRSGLTVPISPERDSCLCLRVGNGGHTVSTVDGGRTVQLWNLDSGTLERTFDVGGQYFESPVLGYLDFRPFVLASNDFGSAALSGDGSTVAISHDDGKIELHDLAHDTTIRTLESAVQDEDIYGPKPNHLVFTADGRYLAATSPRTASGNSVQVWDTTKP
jgi:WD40 repeat protein